MNYINKKIMRTFILFICLILLTGLLNAQDRDLQYFLEQAKLNSPLINKSKNSNKIIQLNIRQINAILSKPTVNLEANVLFAPIILHDNNSNRFELVSQDATNYTGYDLAFSDGGQYQAFASVEQPLFTGSIYRQYAEKADVASKINENNIELKGHEIEHLVSRQYILCLKSKKQSDISSELLKELKHQLEILKKLVENAIYKQTDLMLLQIEIQNYELDYKKYLADYRNNLSDLYILCGIDDTNSVNISETDFKLKPDISYDSKFLTSYALDSLNLKVEQSLFELKYIPQFNLFFNAGMNAIYLPSFNRFGFSTGINFSWNIFDGNQKEIESEKTMIKLKTLEFEKQNFMKQYDINKNKYLNQIKFLNQRISISENQLKEYNKLLELYDKELAQAQVSIMDFKNLFKDIARKRQENLLLKMEKQALINSYNYWNY